MTTFEPIKKYLEQQKVVVIDGGFGTMLAERGVELASPVWSSQAFLDKDGCKLIEQIHYEFFESGADIAISNSYKMSSELLERLEYGIKGPAGDYLRQVFANTLLRMSVEVAQAARQRYLHTHPKARTLKPLIGASLGPYGTSIPYSGAEYKGHYGVSANDLKDFHRKRILALFSAKPDFLAVETIPDLLEAQAISSLLTEWSLNEMNAWMVFTCKDAEHVASGDSFLECVKAADGCPNVFGIGINCTNPVFVRDLLKAAKTVTKKLLVVYPNSGETWNADKDVRQWEGKAVDFSQYVQGWVEEGAVIVGGCCRTTLSDISDIRKFI